MKKVFLCCMILLTIEAIGAEIGLKSGGPKGTYIKIAKDIKRISKKSGFDVKVYEGGSLDNIKSVLWESKYQFAIVQADALQYANDHHEVITSTKGKKFNKNLRDKIKLVMPLYNEEVHVIVRNSPKIKIIADLNGKIVNVDHKSSGSWVTAQNIKKANGLQWKETNYKPGKKEGGKDIVDRLLSKEIDAIIWVAGEPVSYFQNLGGKRGKRIKFLNPDTEGYVSATIESKNYDWIEKDIPTQATKAALITYNYNYGKIPRYNQSAKLIEQFGKIINANLLELKKNSHEKWKSVDPYDYKDLKWPLHPLIKKSEDKGASLTLYGGGPTGTYIKIAQDIQHICAGKIKVNVKNGGSLKNIDAVLSDVSHSTLGIVQYDALLEKKKKDSRLEEKVKIVVPLYNEEIHVIVRNSPKIKTIADLNGKIVNVDHKNSGSWVTAQNIKKANHLKWKETYFKPGKKEGGKDIIDRLLNKEIDAIVWVVGEPVSYFQNLGGKRGKRVKFLNPDTEGYVPATIKAKNYDWVETDIPTQATKAALIASGDKSQAKNIQLVKDIIKDNLDKYLRKSRHPKWKSVEPDDTKKISWSFFNGSSSTAVTLNSEDQCVEDCKTQECVATCFK